MCTQCEKEVIYIEEPRCKKCGKPILSETEECCMDCKGKEWAYEQGKSVWLHVGKVRWSIYQFKYHNRRIFGEYYASELLRLYERNIQEWGIDLIVPVPLHRKRKRKRGYNQAEIIAKILSEKLEIPYKNRITVRIKNTEPQKALQQKERKRNIQGAFQTVRLKETVKCVLVVDDIYTTGNTIHEMARSLREAGAEKVFFLTISIGQGN